MVLNGTSITQTVMSMGHAFATTSYRRNGLAVRPAITDLLDLVNIFTTTKGVPDHVYLVGVSEGGLITTLSVEQHPEVYDGGLAMCGPYGDFRGQVNHFGDFRVVFDYFFPSLMPSSAITIPDGFTETWESGYFSANIKPEIEASENVEKVDQLLKVTGVSPYEYLPPASTDVISNLLWYNVFATEDAKAKLGGQPFNNQDPYRWYGGSDDDETLNDTVDRFEADKEALDSVSEHYQTSGFLSVPLVTLHTTGDPVVPYWHAARYRGKTIAADNIALHDHIEVERHGHCSFGLMDILGAFNQMVHMVENPPEYQPVSRVFLPVTTRQH
jgi:pimeloyl-ACP methyl ester carboxylesterase